MNEITTPPDGAELFTSEQLSMSSAHGENRFSCFHCGSLPKAGDVIIATMKSGKKSVLIVQEMEPKSDTFTGSGLRFGSYIPICYEEDVKFKLPPPAKIGFFL